MRTTISRLSAVSAIIGLLWAGVALSGDWPGFRGPAHDGAVREASLFGGATPALSLGWSVKIGPGYSAIAVADGRAITMFAGGESDVLAAFDTASGAELWRYAIAETYAGHDGSHDGPISTPLIDGDRVFALGPRGQLAAVSAGDGRELWKIDLVAVHAAKAPYYGFTTAPVLLDGVLVVPIGAEDGPAVIGLNAADGSLKWSAGEDTIEYNSPIVAELDGVRQVVLAGQKNVYGLRASDGTVLWEYAHGGDERAMGGMTIVPLEAGAGRLFLMNKVDESMMLGVSRRGKNWKAEPLWTTSSLKQSYVTPVYHDGRLFGMSNRILVCLDASNGEIVWRSRAPGDGFPILVGEMIVMITKPGSLHVAPASADGWNEVASLELFDEHSWSEVAYADGALFARSMARLARIDPASAAPATGDAAAGARARSAFARFLGQLDSSSAEQRPDLVRRFLDTQAQFPIIDAAAGLAHFVWNGEATDVGIVGDMIGTRREDPMTRVAGTNFFHYSIALEPDAAVSYGFIVDYGEAVADPRNERAADGLFGEVSWFSMPAWQGSHHADAEAPARVGRLEELEWESAAFEGETRKARVYLPAGHGAGQRRFPTLYVLGGVDALEKGAMKSVLDRSFGVSVEPAIVVFVLEDAEDARADLRKREPYAALLADELVPTIDAKYATRADAAWRGVVGSGRAGNLAISVAFTRSDLFGRLGSQGATVGADDVLEGQPTPSSVPLVIYMEWGTYHLRSPHEAWDLAHESRALWAGLRRAGYRPAGGERPVGVGWFAWRATLDDMLRALLPM